MKESWCSEWYEPCENHRTVDTEISPRLRYVKQRGERKMKDWVLSVCAIAWHSSLPSPHLGWLRIPRLYFLGSTRLCVIFVRLYCSLSRSDLWPWAAVFRNSLLHISCWDRGFSTIWGGRKVPYLGLFVAHVAKPRNSKSRAVSTHIPYSWDSHRSFKWAFLFSATQRNMKHTRTLPAEEFTVLSEEESRGPDGWSQMFTRAEINKSWNIITVCVLLCIMIGSI
jgi:hypothetical protein